MTAALPAHAAALLAEAFASEVTERLPELRTSIAAALESDDRDAVRLAMRHVHTLASGAAIVGEGEVSVLSRRCEERLVRALASAGHDLPELTAAAADVNRLAELLAPWIDRGAAGAVDRQGRGLT